MKLFGPSNPFENNPVFPDTVGTAIISSAGAVVAQNWPTGMHVARFYPGAIDFYLNPISTSANVPTTNSSGTTLSSGINLKLNAYNDHTFRISTSDSTGYSITGESSGVVTIGFWKLSG